MSIAFGVVQLVLGLVLAVFGFLASVCGVSRFAFTKGGKSAVIRNGATEFALGLCNAVLGVLALCLGEVFAPIGFMVGIIVTLIVLSIVSAMK